METVKHKENENSEEGIERRDILYTVEETPPWYLCLILGFQHYLTALGGIISVPILLSSHFCMDQDAVGLSELIGTIFFVSGLMTILQSTFGVRLPIVQGGTFTFVTPTIAIMSLEKWKCVYTEARKEDINITLADLPEIGSDAHREIWQQRIREIQGAIMVASLFQIVIGFSGLMGFVLRFIGPLAITPTIALTGLSLFGAGSGLASQQWWIALMTMFLITLFSQYLRKIKIPCCVVKRHGGCTRWDIPFFSLFPVILAMVVSWGICAILTTTDVLASDPKAWGFAARTDVRADVLQKPMDLFLGTQERVRNNRGKRAISVRATEVLLYVEACALMPPSGYAIGQWGLPTVSTASVFGILAGVLASMVESVGDYYACARLAGAPPPPVHAVNRGIGIEGIGCLLCGAWGSGNGTTSYSENVGAIGITKVGSRRVVQVGGCFMLVLGCLGKFGALFATIPSPVIGGMFMITFGMVTAVGLSNLQYVDLNSSRNIFILGVSMFFGLSMPVWMQNNDVVNTGSEIADQIISVLLHTSMFVGGLVGFVLDNTIPGTDKERGIKLWTKQFAASSEGQDTESDVYSLLFLQKYFDKWPISKYLPFCPPFKLNRAHKDTKRQEEKPPVGCFINVAMEEEGTHL